MIYTVTFSPTLDYVVSVDHFRVGAINRTTSEVVFPGGKGINVSLVLNNLGYVTTALGFVAGFTGVEIKRLLRINGVESNLIQVEGMSRINMKIRSDVETAINGQGPEITEQDIGTLYSRLRFLIDNDMIVLAGHIPSSLPSNMYEQVLEFLKGRKLRIIVDAERELLTGTLKYHPWLIKPNAEELGDIFGVKLEGRKDEVIPYARKLQDMGAQNVLISLGGNGAVLLTEDGDIYSSDALKGKVVNTVGAGDSMIAGFVAGYLDTDGNYEEAFKEGLCAGAAKAFNLTMTTRKEINFLKRTTEFHIEKSHC